MHRNAMLSKTCVGLPGAGRAAGFSEAAASAAGRANSVQTVASDGLTRVLLLETGTSMRRHLGRRVKAGLIIRSPAVSKKGGWIVRLRILVPLLALTPCAYGGGGPRPLEVSDLRSSPPIEGRPLKELSWVPHTSRLAFLAREGEGESASEGLFVEDAPSGRRERLLGGGSLELPGSSQKASLDGYKWSPDGLLVLLDAAPG